MSFDKSFRHEADTTDVLWQGAYYKFISIDRKAKIESGERENSFH